MPCRLSLALIVVAALGTAGATPALGAPPPNDPPAGAAPFEPYTAPNGTPAQLQAIAELGGAAADRDVPRCLGSSSFARTVWYRLPQAPTTRELTVEASGRTIDPIDLAAFVQPAIPPPPPPPAPPPPAPPPPAPVAKTSQETVNTREPNVCDGRGAGGGADAAEPNSAVTMTIPPNVPVLFQVGRRGAVGAAQDERALVTLEARDRPFVGNPRGDRAGTGTPRLFRDETFVPLAGATITAEDPAQPACPSLGTVWRRLIAGSTGKRLIRVAGLEASTLTAFSGRRPTGDNALDCVNREGGGTLQMVVPVKKGRTVWVRIGTDRTAGGEEATVEMLPGERATVIDGGPGGFDPTPFGPGGGFPSACDSADAEEASVRGPGLRGGPGTQNQFKRVPVKIRVRGSSICKAELRLYGPGGGLYAKGRSIRIKPGRSVVRLPRLRTFRRGRYRLQVKGRSRFGELVTVPTAVRGRLASNVRPGRRSG